MLRTKLLRQKMLSETTKKEMDNLNFKGDSDSSLDLAEDQDNLQKNI